MQLVSARAGASKETLYRHFGNKEELFAEIVRRSSARITGGQDGTLDMNGTPREVLGRLGVNLLEFLPSPIYCHSAGSWSRKPSARRSTAAFFKRKVRAQVHRELARYLRRAARRGELRRSEPELAAKLFLGAIVANYQILGLIAPGFEPFKAQKMRAHVEEAVELFLACYGPSP